MNPTALIEQAELEQQRQQQLQLRLFLCYSTPCLSAGAESVKLALEEEIKQLGGENRTGSGRDWLHGAL